MCKPKNSLFYSQRNKLSSLTIQYISFYSLDSHQPPAPPLSQYCCNARNFLLSNFTDFNQFSQFTDTNIFIKLFKSMHKVFRFHLVELHLFVCLINQIGCSDVLAFNILSQFIILIIYHLKRNIQVKTIYQTSTHVVDIIIEIINFGKVFETHSKCKIENENWNFETFVRLQSCFSLSYQNKTIFACIMTAIYIRVQIRIRNSVSNDSGLIKFYVIRYRQVVNN